jgi:hypothetical protein
MTNRENKRYTKWERNRERKTITTHTNWIEQESNLLINSNDQFVTENKKVLDLVAIYVIFLEINLIYSNNNKNRQILILFCGMKTIRLLRLLWAHDDDKALITTGIVEYFLKFNLNLLRSWVIEKDT